MQVSVTTDRLQRGQRKNGYRCPIALALNEQTGRTWHVSLDDAELFDPTTEQTLGIYPLPETARRFTRAYEQGQMFVPFSFYLPYQPVGRTTGTLFEETVIR